MIILHFYLRKEQARGRSGKEAENEKGIRGRRAVERGEGGGGSLEGRRKRGEGRGHKGTKLQRNDLHGAIVGTYQKCVDIRVQTYTNNAFVKNSELPVQSSCFGIVEEDEVVKATSGQHLAILRKAEGRCTAGVIINCSEEVPILWVPQPHTSVARRSGQHIFGRYLTTQDEVVVRNKVKASSAALSVAVFSTATFLVANAIAHSSFFRLFFHFALLRIFLFACTTSSLTDTLCASIFASFPSTRSQHATSARIRHVSPLPLTFNQASPLASLICSSYIHLQ
mmetsp:Transcript_23766/g.59988  ORF Transcript_23766/g.59988 Transcript_23766/m.59988 type:complete len:282 (+) Transcript_23766:107-952(+)